MFHMIERIAYPVCPPPSPKGQHIKSMNVQLRNLYRRTSLSADDITSDGQGLWYMFRVANHLIHVAHKTSASATVYPSQHTQYETPEMRSKEAKQRGGLTFITGIPALCNFSTSSCGGTPTAQTKSAAFSSIMISIKVPRLPLL